MNEAFLAFQQSGKKLLVDTKTPATKQKREQIAKNAKEPLETDPHKAFVKRTITDKPKKQDVVKEFKRFIEEAESKL